MGGFSCSISDYSLGTHVLPPLVDSDLMAGRIYIWTPHSLSSSLHTMFLTNCLFYELIYPLFIKLQAPIILDKNKEFCSASN